jgi:hypothetical protein
MEIIEFIVDSLLIFVTIHIGLTLVAWLVRRCVASELDEVSNDLELERLIPLTVEVVEDQYFCYNSITQDFVCQGVNLVEIVKRFKQRYPDKSAAIYNGDETAVRTLKSQLKELDESSSSIRYTS